MTLMVSGLYEALKDAGASEKLAQKAAEEVADYEALSHEIRSDLKLVKWMLGFNLAFSLALLFKIFS